MLKKSLNFIILSFLISFNLAAQDTTRYEGVLWLTISNQDFTPNANGITNSTDFNTYLQTRNVQFFIQLMPWAKTEQLRHVYKLKCDYSEASLYSEIQSFFGDAFSNIEFEYKPISCYDPADYFWYLTLSDPTNWLWYLLKIQGNLAWDITKGDPNLKVALVDDGIDPTHPDLIGKISPSTDFYTGSAFNPTDHGTSTGTLLAGETVDQGGTPNGQLASIGYNTKIMFSSYMSVPTCLYASSVLGARILSISWYFSSCSPNASDLLAEQEILDNGTTIFRAAGNGSQNCGGGRLYPFSGYEDPRTIVVTSSDKDDNHQNLNPGGNTNSHYPEVDICSPGYVLLAGVAINASNSSWPYFGGWGGTSQSTPIAAGVGALMLAIDNCLQPEKIQDIIKLTADPIADAASYPGLIGAGRINAYKSVLGAFDRLAIPTINSGQPIYYTYGSNQSISGNLTSHHFYDSPDQITSDADIASNVTISYRGVQEINLDVGFTAEAGSDFHAFIYNCSAPGERRNMQNILSSKIFKKPQAIFSNFVLYPNPNTGSFTLEMLGDNDSEKSVQVLDIMGNIVWQDRSNSKVQTTIDISKNAKGIYFVKIQQGDKVSTQKIVLM